jgi:p-cumate 2,3-dioxygenase beta subunit
LKRRKRRNRATMPTDTSTGNAVAWSPSRSQLEDFLYAESALLDEWRLDEWLGLFTYDARYEVPATDLPDCDPEQTLYLIADDRSRLESRVRRLESPNAHAEQPRSRTRRLLGNVRIIDATDDHVAVVASFIVHRARSGHVDVFAGEYRYELVLGADDEIRIRYRRATLDSEALRPCGSISFIL